MQKTDLEFLEEMSQRVDEFVNSSAEMMELEPVNGYLRRLIHKLADIYHLSTQSVGEGEDRYVCLIRNEKTAIPADKSKLLGGLTSDTKPTSPKKSYEKEPEKERPRGREKERNRGDRGDRGDRDSSSNSDFGDKVFQTIPGTTIVLRQDGSVGIIRKDDKSPVIAERVIDNGIFKVVNNTIVCPGDDQW
ncbi:MAG: hypothetical protein HQM12_01305 [SAR324 cluster bacterium]|nr:hypothetical protein [SAR324 cluster bacterium]MBF0351610.1 hypothetical protein [SAR324 cluster bacterium]